VPMFRSKLCENGPEIVVKNTLMHSTPDVTPRKIKKFDPSEVLYAGSSGIKQTEVFICERIR
jgi:hypothetical protein